MGAGANYEYLVDQEVDVEAIIATGGITRKFPQVVELLADVLNRDVAVASVQESGAVGAAILGAAAAGLHTSVEKAAAAMARHPYATFRPRLDRVVQYNELYQEYCRRN